MIYSKWYILIVSLLNVLPITFALNRIKLKTEALELFFGHKQNKLSRNIDLKLISIKYQYFTAPGTRIYSINSLWPGDTI